MNARWGTDPYEHRVGRVLRRRRLRLLGLVDPSDPVTGSIQRELAIIRRSGADRRTIALGRRGLSSVAATVWHLQPLSLTALDIAFGCIVGVVAYLLPVGGAALAVGYVAGRLHLASGAFLLAWRRRFRSLVDGVLAGDASRVGNRRRTATFERPTAGGAGRG